MFKNKLLVVLFLVFILPMFFSAWVEPLMPIGDEAIQISGSDDSSGIDFIFEIENPDQIVDTGVRDDSCSIDSSGVVRCPTTGQVSNNLVGFLRKLNASIILESDVGGFVDVSTVEGRTSAVTRTQVTSTGNTTSQSQVIERISVGNLQVVELDGEKVFVATLNGFDDVSVVDQEFSIDLSDVSIDYSSVRGQAFSDVKHGTYNFKVAAVSKDREEDEIHRFIHFRVTNDYPNNIVDCNPFVDKETLMNKVGSIRRSLEIHSVSEIIKESVRAAVISTAASLGVRVPNFIAGRAATATRVTSIPGAKVVGLVVKKTAATTAVVSGPLAIMSKFSYGEWVDETDERSRWDPRKYFPALFSDNLTIDFTDDTTTHMCIEKTYVRGELTPPELKFNVKKIDFFNENQSLRMFFTVEPMRVYNRSNPIYYAPLPN